MRSSAFLGDDTIVACVVESFVRNVLPYSLLCPGKHIALSFTIFVYYLCLLYVFFVVCSVMVDVYSVRLFVFTSIMLLVEPMAVFFLFCDLNGYAGSA